MRILQVITLSELGGAQSVVANIANTLCDDNEVMVVAGEGDGMFWHILDNRVRKVKCRFLHRELSPVNDVLTIIWMYRLYLKYRPDIIHLHSSKAGMLGRIAFPKKKTIYTVHGFESLRIAYRKFLPIERFMQKRCRSIVAVCHYDVRNMKHEGITNNVYCVYNGINEVSNDMFNSFNIPKQYNKTVLCIARNAKPKRLDLFVEIARQLSQYAFVWIGNKENILASEQNIFFLGSKPNASIYCQCADLFILPSNYEGLPMTIIEAMSYGRPIVASNVGGISEIVIDNCNGYAVENTVDAFVEKISLILNDEQLAHTLSENSKTLYEQSFTVDKMVKEYYKLYEM